MNRKREGTIAFIGGFVISMALFAVGVSIGAQERDLSYPQTRTWVLGEYQRWDQASLMDRIRVIDTAGVCLYLMEAEQYSWRDQHAQLVAVPKTQLPKGAGCQ